MWFLHKVLDGCTVTCGSITSAAVIFALGFPVLRLRWRRGGGLSKNGSFVLLGERAPRRGAAYFLFKGLAARWRCSCAVVVIGPRSVVLLFLIVE
jgi:hypothetical protein